MTDYVLQQILDKSRQARDGGFGVLSKGEMIAAALVLNRADWLTEMNYTMAEAIERLGGEWLARVPVAARTLQREADEQERDTVAGKPLRNMGMGAK